MKKWWFCWHHTSLNPVSACHASESSLVSGENFRKIFHTFSLSREIKLIEATAVFAGEGRGEGITMNLLLKNARKLRKHATDTERVLWRFLRSNQLHGYKFRRQHPIPPYIVDFICLQKRLIIELDGGQHALAKKYDEKRTLFLMNKGFKVLRFWNNEVFENIDAVIEHIFKALEADCI